MMYPRNPREISFLTTAECRDIFARLVRELDKLDEDGVFGPFGWRDRLAGPTASSKSMSGAYRDQLATAAECSDLVQRQDSGLWSRESGFESLDRSHAPLDTNVEIGLD